MKTLSFCLLAAVLATISTSEAAPKSMGRSAIIAARLKKSPPPNYLAHYLPDDRYKIAGGVWKYVSTDLDTYYHVPSSPNMLRQSPNRVIGFATAEEAEEAGYMPDPNDGTAARSGTADLPAQGDSVQAPFIRNDQERRYWSLMAPLLREGQNNIVKLAIGLSNASSSSRRGGANVSVGLVSAGQTNTSYLRQTRSLLARFNRVKPPARYQRVHNAIRSAFASSISSITALNGVVDARNPALFGPVREQFARTDAAFKKVSRELLLLR